MSVTSPAFDAIQHGEPAAAETLLPLADGELRALAQAKMTRA